MATPAHAYVNLHVSGPPVVEADRNGAEPGAPGYMIYRIGVDAGHDVKIHLTGIREDALAISAALRAACDRVDAMVAEDDRIRASQLTLEPAA